MISLTGSSKRDKTVVIENTPVTSRLSVGDSDWDVREMLGVKWPR